MPSPKGTTTRRRCSAASSADPAAREGRTRRARISGKTPPLPHGRTRSRVWTMRRFSRKNPSFPSSGANLSPQCPLPWRFRPNSENFLRECPLNVPSRAAFGRRGSRPADSLSTRRKRGFAPDLRFCKEKTARRRLGIWSRELDSNQRPPGYEPDELPDCSIPHYVTRIHVCCCLNATICHSSTRCRKMQAASRKKRYMRANYRLIARRSPAPSQSCAIICPCCFTKK